MQSKIKLFSDIYLPFDPTKKKLSDANNKFHYYQNIRIIIELIAKKYNY